MKYWIFLTLSFLIIVFISITCTEDPAGPDTWIKPTAAITGWVYDMWNRPIKDVLVSVNADSAVPGVSDVTGQFIIGKVKEGTYLLRFTHRDYEDNPSCTVSVEQGVDDTVPTPVKLSYAYYILKGIVSVNGSPQAAAGVAVADYTEGALTGPGGSFILKQVPKNDTVTLVCAYGDIAVKTSKIGGLLANDTNDAGTINLTDKGPTVSGRVYYPDLSVAPNITVTAVAGGLQSKTGDDGYFTLRNIPANEDGVIVTVNEGGYIGAAIGANAVAGAIITGCDIYLKPEPNIINSIKLITCDVYVPHTAVTAILRVYPVTEVNTVIQSYIWNVSGTPYTTSLPECPITVSGLSPKTAATVTAVNTFGDTSATESFTIFLTGTAPVIDSIAVSKDKITYAPSVTITEGEWAYFYVQVTDLYGGLTSMEWQFGDGATWTSPDSSPSVGHLYSTSGTYNAVFKAVDSDANIALDTVVIIVQKSSLQSPVLVYPDSGAVLNTPNDSITLQWIKSPGTGIVYNAYMTWSNTIPSESDSIAVGLTDSLFRAKVDSAKTYYWCVKAIRTGDGVIAWSSIFHFTVYTNIVNNAPVFITTADSMTDSMYVGVSYDDTLKASDADGDALIFSFIDSVAGMSLIDSVFSWTPTDNDTGQHTVTVKVSDGKGGTDTLTWTITATTPINNPPVFVTISDSMTGSMYVGVSYTDTLKASDADGDVLTFSFIDSIIVMNLIDSVFSWTPTANDTGQHIVIVIVSDGKGGTDSLTWTIIVINGAPVIITDPVPKTVDEYSSASFFIVVTGDSLVYQWQKDGLDIDSATDSVYTIDSVLCADSGMYRCVVTNSFGSDTSNSAKLTVKPYIPNILYVKADATGNNNGSSWIDAFTDLQRAIDTAKENVQIWVAAGTYKPTKEQGGTGERFKSFSMKTYVSIYGGFVGTETQLSQRNWETNKTILSGDIGVEGDSTDNCYHVFYHTPDMLISNHAVLDGFKITAGNADGTDPHDKGGGMYSKSSLPTIKNCLFAINSSKNGGGGMYNTDGASLELYNCTFDSNYTSTNGGGIYNNTLSNPVIINSIISANNSEKGGGIYNDNSSPIIDSSIIVNNEATHTTYSGGGIYNNNKSEPIVNSTYFAGNTATGGGGISSIASCPKINNCTFFNNTVTTNYGGGGVYILNSSKKIIITNCTFASNIARQGGGINVGSNDTIGIVNCTFTGNSANTYGGGIYIYRVGGRDSGDIILNSIFWNNTSGMGGNGIFKSDSICLSVKYSVIKDGYPDDTATIITDDPNLGLLSNNGGPVQTISLNTGSSALNAGVYVYKDDVNIFYNTDGGTSYLDVYSNPYTPVGTVIQLTTTDARGVARPQGSGIDIGAFEKE